MVLSHFIFSLVQYQSQLKMNFMHFLEQPVCYYYTMFPTWNPLYVCPAPLQYFHQKPVEKTDQTSLEQKKIRPQIPAQNRRKVIKKKETPIQSNKNKLNTKNIIPNLTRKLLAFLTSESAKALMLRIDPTITRTEISKVVTFVKSVQNIIGTYIGKKSLRKLWYKDSQSEKSIKIYEMVRKMSRFYLQSQCVQSIMANKKIKSELKLPHLQYRRKLIKMLIGNEDVDDE